MSPKSFYDLNYIIDINERRIEQYLAAYQKVLDRFTIIILIYSAITIFLTSIIQDIFLSDTIDWFLLVCFCVFSILFIASLFNAVRLILPVKVFYLMAPVKYYEELRLAYEDASGQPDIIDIELKAIYIGELEIALNNILLVFKRKTNFYYSALVYALISAIPYVICIAVHISKKGV